MKTFHLLKLAFCFPSPCDLILKRLIFMAGIVTKIFSFRAITTRCVHKKQLLSDKIKKAHPYHFGKNEHKKRQYFPTEVEK